MFARGFRMLAVGLLAVGALAAAPVAAGAKGGTFPWVKITTPSSTFTYKVDSAEGAVNHLRVDGLASSDVASVNIFCGITSHSALNGAYFAQDVPVTDGKFSVVAT